MIFPGMILAALQPADQAAEGAVAVTIVGDDFDVKSARAPERTNPQFAS